MRRLTTSIVAGALLGLGLATPVVADEVKTSINALSILNVIAPPLESRDAAYNRSLRDRGPAPASPFTGEVLADGTVRYGRTTVTVKNPCPPGTAHYEPPPLPGRRK